jgi:hypothetical protein
MINFFKRFLRKVKIIFVDKLTKYLFACVKQLKGDI